MNDPAQGTSPKEGSAPEDPGKGQPAPAGSGSGSPSASGAPNGSQPAKVLVSYSRSGGFAGLHDRVSIDESGKASVIRRDQVRESQLPPDTFRDLKAAFGTAGFSKLRKSYPARGADLFTYVITYQGRTVTAMDSAVPPSLEPLIRMLNDIIDRSGISMR